jgi:hypothetical protein
MNEMASKIYLSLLALASTVIAQKCPIQFDGRVPKGSTPATFDSSTSPFNPSFVFGAGELYYILKTSHELTSLGLTWSGIVQLPTTTPSLVHPHHPFPHDHLLMPSQFDANTSIPVEVTISDASIFQGQTGFRRAEFLPASNSGSDPSTQGIKTLHFSLQKDDARSLNYSHEYQLVFLETADYSTNQFALKTGSISGREGQDPGRLVLQSNVNNPTDLHAVPFTAGVWHNYAITLDFDSKYVPLSSHSTLFVLKVKTVRAKSTILKAALR